MTQQEQEEEEGENVKPITYGFAAGKKDHCAQNEQLTAGTPIKNLNIACYSLFRDVDFHARFHYDHYEYSGRWHGQYRGYKHGRVHQYENKHTHIIGVALALEMGLGASWVSAAFWAVLLSMMIYLRLIQKRRQNRELQESVEDAMIFASSRDAMDPHNMQQVMSPVDQMSMTSQQSSMLSQVGFAS